MSWLDFLPDITLPEHIDIDVINIGPDVDGDLVQGDSVEGDQVDADLAIKSEGDIVPITEIDRIVPGKLSGDAPIELSEAGNELIIDPENFEDKDEWDNVVKPGLKAGWREQEKVSTRNAYPILIQAERNITDEKISEMESFFSGKVFSSDFRLLQSSLTIDRAMNGESGAGMTDAELKQRKRELADKYHDAAYSLPSMCTSGYFDEGELFRQVYEEIDQSREYEVSEYDSIFRKMILQKPFVAYSRGDQSEEELLDIVKGKISRLPDYDIPLPYIDVRGLGTSNHQKIRSVMQSIEEEWNGIEYDERLGEEELIVRIDGESIKQMQ